MYTVYTNIILIIVWKKYLWSFGVIFFDHNPVFCAIQWILQKKWIESFVDETQSDVFDDSGARTASYTSTMKVKICGIGNINNYWNANGEQRQPMTVGFADLPMAVNGI